ncbi:methyl jasmonate esterase 1-like [Nymphaea colorata]|nr:methyl jasmonate esterase 1-like [Nymphaea colorata]
MVEKKRHHFVLVHGCCHGGWSWYKVASLLRGAGHEVRPLDLRASGIDAATPDQVSSFADYNQPLVDLLESLPAHEGVVLVGHSFGGLSIASAAERFPTKVAVAVFVTAAMPNPKLPPSMLLHNYFFVQKERIESWEDSSLVAHTDTSRLLPATIEFGTQFMRSRLYNNCSVEDYTLATMLKRAAPFDRDDLSCHDFVSEINYGRTKRVYVVCKDDQVIKESFQRWMIEVGQVDDVMEIKGADHMPMFSKPHDLCNLLLQIADTHSS